MKKKVFETEQAAQHFASQVGGIVRMTQLPDYMGVIIVYVVEWEKQE